MKIHIFYVLRIESSTNLRSWPQGRFLSYLESPPVVEWDFGPGNGVATWTTVHGASCADRFTSIEAAQARANAFLSYYNNEFQTITLSIYKVTVGIEKVS